MSDIKITVSASIDRETWDKAAVVLDNHYITVSDALRLMMHYIAAEEALPFPCVPASPETIAAMKAAKRDDVVSFDNVADLMAYLNADDEDD